MRLSRTLSGAMAAVAISVASTAGAVTTNGNINVNVTTETVELFYISEVALSGPGGGVFVFPDPITAPETGDEPGALLLALAGLGLPTSTATSSPALIAMPRFSGFEEIIVTDFNPVDDPLIVIGLMDDFENWIPITSQNVTVDVTQITTLFNPFRLEADIVTATPVPLPAPAALLVAALAGSAVLCRRRARARCGALVAPH